MRVNRTVRDFETALGNLLQRVPFDKLTVDQICKEALLHRSSFYRYFHDKYDLLEQLIKSQLNVLVAKTESEDDLIEAFITYVGEHRALFQNLTTVNVHSSLNAELFKIISEILLDRRVGDGRDVVSQALDHSPNPKMLAYILSGATMGAFEWWREENYSVPPTEVMAVIRQVLYGTQAISKAHPAVTRQKGRHHVGND